MSFILINIVLFMWTEAEAPACVQYQVFSVAKTLRCVIAAVLFKCRSPSSSAADTFDSLSFSVVAYFTGCLLKWLTDTLLRVTKVNNGDCSEVTGAAPDGQHHKDAASVTSLSGPGEAVIYENGRLNSWGVPLIRGQCISLQSAEANGQHLWTTYVPFYLHFSALEQPDNKWLLELS